MVAKTRIATVKATGKRYVVQSLELPKDPRHAKKAHCWGEVVSYKGGSAKHGESKHFLLDAVDITEVERTPALLRALWDQGIESLRAKGHEVVVRTSRRGNVNARDYGTRAQQETRAAARARALEEQARFRQENPWVGKMEAAAAEILARSMPMWTGADPSYRAPKVATTPVDRALPFTLSDSHQDTLTTVGWLQATFGSEFIEQSYVVALTAEEARVKGQTYDTSDYHLYRDPVLNVYWRNTGCWD